MGRHHAELLTGVGSGRVVLLHGGYVRCAQEWPAFSFHRWLRAGVYPKNRACWDDGRELSFDDLVATVGE